VNPVNFLSPDLVSDAVLGQRVEPGSAFHDAWGFRNERVPEHADVVAIGDSQTYGVSANAYASWPAWLARITGRSVYNLGMGGYGPIQYEHLLNERALRLAPSAVVVGFYFGNDLLDSYRTVYGLEHWSGLRREGIPPAPPVRADHDADEGLISAVQLWLGRNSVLYRLVGRAFGQSARTLLASYGEPAAGETRLSDPDLETAFTPLVRLEVLDLERLEVREGLRLGLDALARMQETCRTAGVRFLVVLIPTKETVFADRLAGRQDLPHAAEIAKLLRYEADARRQLSDFLAARRVELVDPTPRLRAAAEKGPIYPGNEDGHPLASGYEAIAEAVADAMDAARVGHAASDTEAR
jgi:lysophospholipase L1-like esterase